MQDTFVPIPRHIYGELARSKEGNDVMQRRGIVTKLLSTLATGIGSNGFCGQCRSALWALGHIGASDYGFVAIVSEKPKFVQYVISLALSAENYSLRATAFIVLGLLGRSRGGALYLAAEQWDISPGVSVAVALPRDLSVLFRSIDGRASFDIHGASPASPGLKRKPTFDASSLITPIPDFVKLLRPFKTVNSTTKQPPASSVSVNPTTSSGFGDLFRIRSRASSNPTDVPSVTTGGDSNPLVDNRELDITELNILNAMLKVCGNG
jgi:hypothetical protein